MVEWYTRVYGFLRRSLVCRTQRFRVIWTARDTVTFAPFSPIQLEAEPIQDCTGSTIILVEIFGVSFGHLPPLSTYTNSV